MDKKEFKCVFDRQAGIKGCHALNEKICDEKECPFYKSDEEYKLDENRFCVERGNDLSLSQY